MWPKRDLSDLANRTCFGRLACACLRLGSLSESCFLTPMALLVCSKEHVVPEMLLITMGSFCVLGED